VAFTWSGAYQDNDDIYLKLVGSSELRRLTTDALQDGAPAWSPDGREIAFLRTGRDRTTVHAVSPITGAERKISDLGVGDWLGLSWSPDGRWLALGRTITAHGGGLYVLPVQGGDLRTLTTRKHPYAVGNPPTARWSRPAFPDAPDRSTVPWRCRARRILTPGAAHTVAPMLSLDVSWQPPGRVMARAIYDLAAISAWRSREAAHPNGRSWRATVPQPGAPAAITCRVRVATQHHHATPP
jgi:dipeptidyl aminopeptidase/acylaminoacyl peptidase